MAVTKGYKAAGNSVEQPYAQLFITCILHVPEPPYSNKLKLTMRFPKWLTSDDYTIK